MWRLFDRHPGDIDSTGSRHLTMGRRGPAFTPFGSEALRFISLLAAGVAAVSLADLFAPASVLVIVFALAIVGVVGAYLRGNAAGR